MLRIRLELDVELSRLGIAATLAFSLLAACHKDRIVAPGPFTIRGHGGLTKSEALAKVTAIEQVWSTEPLQSYTYVRSAAKSEVSEHTIVAIESGTVMRRVFIVIPYNRGPWHGWDEARGEVGSHSEGFAPLTMEALFRFCRDVVIPATDGPLQIEGQQVLRRCAAAKKADSPFLVLSSFAYSLPPVDIPACQWTCDFDYPVLFGDDMPTISSQCSECRCMPPWHDRPTPNRKLEPCPKDRGIGGPMCLNLLCL
jgi:hypothetical protein